MAKSELLERTVEGDISDATLARLLRWLAIGVASLVVIGGLVVAVSSARASAERAAPLGPIELGFLQDMIDHHQQALVISNTYLANNKQGGAAPYAREVLLYQTREIQQIDKILADAKGQRGASDRNAMIWMGDAMGMNMATPVATMPGMQTPERLTELSAATGATADRLFFDMMTDHHRGGVSMAEFAASKSKRASVRSIADIMARGQRVEIVEYAQAVTRLGL